MDKGISFHYIEKKVERFPDTAESCCTNAPFESEEVDAVAGDTEWGVQHEDSAFKLPCAINVVFSMEEFHERVGDTEGVCC